MIDSVIHPVEKLEPPYLSKEELLELLARDLKVDKPIESRVFMAKDFNKMLAYKERYHGVVIRHSMPYGVLYEVKIPPTQELIEIRNFNVDRETFMQMIWLASALLGDKHEFFENFWHKKVTPRVEFKTINYLP